MRTSRKVTKHDVIIPLIIAQNAEIRILMIQLCNQPEKMEKNIVKVAVYYL